MRPVKKRRMSVDETAKSLLPSMEALIIHFFIPIDNAAGDALARIGFPMGKSRG